ncbi:MAG: DedA family protein [Sphingomonas sp.]|jgi:membrane protein YqaA with SNARE-associated domain|uniref:YqaA family protein n=1 Tax=Sphingomonas sp. TaxID=28214 RepID=UPI0026210B94|nr:YqaA family protein [Sphingomonas sp.]MDK2767131.1 DedA family protein [Sphingomonas sp.]
MFRALYDWTLKLAAHRHSDRYLAAVSFAESSFFPIPPDVMLIPMMLAQRQRAYWIATICTVASVLGGIAGYAIGYFLFDTIGQWIIDLYHLGSKVESVRALYDEWGAVVTLTAGITPLPFKLITIANGFFHYNFPLFVILAVIGRGFRFYLLAFLVHRWGEPVQAFIEERLTLLGWLAMVLLIGGFGVITLI